jgi:protein TonB
MEQNAIDQFSNFKKRILNGKSESWYKMEIKKRIVLLKGKMNGISTLYYENSQIKRIENYKMMNLLTENVLMKTELKYFFSYYIKPEFPGGIKEFYKYVGENFKSPNSAKGQIKVAFVVQIDGTLKTSK